MKTINLTLLDSRSERSCLLLREIQHHKWKTCLLKFHIFLKKNVYSNGSLAVKFTETNTISHNSSSTTITAYKAKYLHSQWNISLTNLNPVLWKPGKWRSLSNNIFSHAVFSNASRERTASVRRRHGELGVLIKIFYNSACAVHMRDNGLV